ncbi:MAG TPA: formyltetrahydrofolate deformylase [Gammaproteobacteria bacterium]|nr:formyltetrahydrofolate deformylase [Gammaproteobacteria bacterium]|tara:strand:- start:133 stop:1041 length:909 start_codon:yes stop_codon:yes gene_type:complete
MVPTVFKTAKSLQSSPLINPASPFLEFILNFSCPDKAGLVRTVANWLFDEGCNIIDSDQFGDPASGLFFMRVHFNGEDKSRSTLSESFSSIAIDNKMSWELWSTDNKPNVLIMVSKQDHCLIDLLYRTRNQELPINIPLVVSNHRDTYPLAAAEDIDFLHISADDKPAMERQLIAEIERRKIDFIVLARYMQILGPNVCDLLPGRIINIHHSFLPGFKGARPYQQAFDRGVKLIGATAHYVTSDLDEGPIIEQGIERVDHRMDAKQLAAVGRDIERIVLSKAVRYQAEHRILLNGDRTVVFQ